MTTGSAVAERPASRRLLVVAGEASGDLHAASLARELRAQLPDIELLGIGGDRMQAQGVQLLYHYRSLAVVGLTEVLAHLGDVRRAMRALVGVARRRRFDGVVLVDYPDFNLALARRLRRVRPELPILYYISPQVWAWRRGRIAQIRRLVDRMIVILPFEERLYADAGVPVDFVGHPLLDAAPMAGSRTSFATRHGVAERDEWIALVPGSRRDEVRRLLPPLLGTAALLLRDDPARTFLVPVAQSLEAATYEQALAGAPPEVGGRVRLVHDDGWEVLRHSRGAVVCSGTATLEAALVGTPMVVVYRTSWLTYNLGKLLVRIRDIGLVNVVGERRGVPELLQDDVTPAAISRALEPLLRAGEARETCRAFLRQVADRLGGAGASRRAAAAVLATLAEPLRGAAAGSHPSAT